jgi:integrase
VRLGNAITRVKSVFKYGADNGLIDKAIRYGGEFKKPDKSVLRRHRARNGEKILEAVELRRILEGLAGKQVETGRTNEETGQPETVTLERNPALRAMILLGINAGFGNAECGQLPLSAVDLDRGWVDFPRPKTGVPRRCPLWPETVTAVREALAERPEPKDQADAGVVFLNSMGRRWVRTTEKSCTDSLTVRFGELLKRFGAHRDGIGFYTLRHTFRTIADAARDPVATDLIMGHTDQSMGGHYRERIEDSRLRAVTDHVRQWLFAEAPDGATGADSTVSENCDPTGPCDPRPTSSGSEGAQGSQKSALALPKAARPVLRLYVG